MRSYFFCSIAVLTASFLTQMSSRYPDRRRRDEPYTQSYDRRRNPDRHYISQYERGLDERMRHQRDRDMALKAVCITNLHMKATERDIREVFSRIGAIETISLVKDRNSQKSKGIAYVAFVDKEMQQKALQLAGKEIMGQGIRVAIADTQHIMAPEPSRRPERPAVVVVSGLPPGICTKDIRDMFRAFGAVSDVILRYYDPKTGQGSVLVRIERVTGARDAVAALHGCGPASGSGARLSVHLLDEHPDFPVASGQGSTRDAAAEARRLGATDDAGDGQVGRRRTRGEYVTTLAPPEGMPMDPMLKHALAVAKKGATKRKVSRQEQFRMDAAGLGDAKKADGKLT